MRHPKISVFFISLAAFLAPFTQTVYVPILPELQHSLQAPLFLIHLTLSLYTLVIAPMQVVYGPWVDRRGRRPVLLLGLTVYLIGTIGCLLSASVLPLLLFRVIQAAGVAAGSVIAAAVIGDLYEGSARTRAMGNFQLTVSMGFVLGPFAGGWLGHTFGFQGIFIALTLLGLLVLAANLLLLQETGASERRGQPFRWGQFAEIARERTGMTVMILGLVQYYLFYTLLVFLPEQLSLAYGLPPEHKGSALLLLTAAMAAGTVLGSRWPARLSLGRRLLLFSGVHAGFSLLLLLSLSGSFLWTAAAVLLFGTAFGMCLPVHTALLAEIYPNRRATSIGVYNLFRFGGMGIGPILGGWLYGAGGALLLFGCGSILITAAVVWALLYSRPLQSKPAVHGRSQQRF